MTEMLKWTREPKNYDIQPDRIEITTDPHTDLWQRTYYHFRNGTVNIRAGNGTDYARITAVPDGTECEWIATAQNGWHAVKIGSQVGWVSGKYSAITTE